MLEPIPLLNVLAKLRVLAKESTAYSRPTIDWYNAINNNSQLFRIDIAFWVNDTSFPQEINARARAHTHTHTPSPSTYSMK